MDVDELPHALGGIVLEAAYLERVLRTAFSALVGSKYAAVIDGRLTAARTLSEVRQVAEHVAGAAHDLGSAMATALGPGWVYVENELRQEPGPDIATG
jgi:hypothetical protein